MQLVALKDFKHPETRKMVRAGDPVELGGENARLYRRLGAVRSRPVAAPKGKRKK